MYKRQIDDRSIVVDTAMDAEKWAEAEPGQDGGPEGEWPHHWWFGKLPLFGGVTLTAKVLIPFSSHRGSTCPKTVSVATWPA